MARTLLAWHALHYRVAGLVAVVALVLAAIVDTATFMLLPHGSELNPIAVLWPDWAILAKAALLVFVSKAPLGPYRTPVAAFGAGYFLAGALHNIAVLGGI
jgi:hypothetical protein